MNGPQWMYVADPSGGRVFVRVALVPPCTYPCPQCVAGKIAHPDDIDAELTLAELATRDYTPGGWER